MINKKLFLIPIMFLLLISMVLGAQCDYDSTFYDMYEDFEGTGVPTDWVDDSGNDVDYDSTTQIFSGNESVYMTLNQANTDPPAMTLASTNSFEVAVYYTSGNAYFGNGNNFYYFTGTTDLLFYPGPFGSTRTISANTWYIAKMTKTPTEVIYTLFDENRTVIINETTTTSGYTQPNFLGTGGGAGTVYYDDYLVYNGTECYHESIPPITNQSTITTTDLRSNNTLEGFCNVTDANDDSLTYEYNWYKNSVSLSVNASTLSPANFSKTDDIMFECRGYDGTNFSSWMNSTEVTIINTEPVTNEVNILNTDLGSNNTLNGYCNITDFDEDSLTYTYDWYKNNVSLSINNINLTNDNFIKNDNIIFTCRATDGENYSLWKNSSEVRVLNTAPTIQEAIIITTDLRSNNTLEGYCNITDYDGDSFEEYYNWYKNDVSLDINNITLSPGNYSIDDEIIFSCKTTAELNITSIDISGTQAYYAFEGDYTDETSNYDATNHGVTLTTDSSGIIGNASIYTNDYIDTNYGSGWSYITDMSVNFWAKTSDGLTGEMMWLGAYGATSLRPNMLVSTHTSGFAIKYTDLSGSIILQRLAVGVSRSEIANGDWVMITITKGGNTGADLKLYINGSLATTTNVFPAGTLSNSGTGNDFYFGTANQNGAPYASGYTGQFDEVSFFNTELSTDDITYLYNLGNPTSNQQYDYPSSIDNTIWSNFVNSTSKTLLNTEPVIDVVNITSTSLLSNNTLEGFCNATDYDGNSTTFEYDWYNDGVSLSINNINLTPENFIKGDDVMFSCRATDGVNFSIWKNSTAVTIFNNLQVLSGFNMIDISADTNYYFSEYIDYFRIDVTDLDEENINTYITVKNPDGDTILDNITMVNVTGDTKGYETDLELTAVGNWTIDIVSSDDFGVIVSYNTTFEVKLLIVENLGDIFGYDFETLPIYSLINSTIYIYDYGVVEIHIDKDSTWSTVSTLIQTMKDESQIVILTFDEDLSDVTSSINFISTNYADLINANHLNAIRELKLDVTTTENSTNSVLINSIVNTMFKNVTNKFPISIRHYNESGINTNYVSIDAQTYITANNLKSYLEQEVGYLRNTSSKSRMYYSLTDELKVSTSEWQSNIFNKMRSTINATASYSQDFVGELNNKDIIVVNYNNTQSDISISPASLISADAYDYTNKRVLQGSPTSEINISLDANSYAMVYFTNISKLEIDENDNVYLYSKNGRILETNTDYSAGSVNAFQFVTSTVNVEDARIILTDPSFEDMGFYIWYGTHGAEAIGSFGKYDLIIIADNTDETWVEAADTVTQVFGYTSLNTYGNNNIPVGCVLGELGNDCSSWNRTQWIQDIKLDVDVWTNMTTIDIFIDGLDIGAVNDVDGLFGDSIVEISDYIKISKGRELILNTYTAYEDYANLGDYTMRESACGRWDNTATSPVYSYEDISLEIQRANYHKSHGVPVLAQIFGNITDYEKSYYCYMQTKVLYGDLAKISYNQPLFDYTGAADDFQWNYYKYPDIGDELESDYTIVGSDSYSRRFEHGIIIVNTTSKTVNYVSDAEVNSMSLCGYYYDNDDRAAAEGYMHFVINDNLSKGFDVTDDDLTAFTKTYKCVNISNDFYEPSGFYEIEFYYIDNDANYMLNNGLYMYHSTLAGNDRLSFWDSTSNNHPSQDETDYTYYATGDNWAFNFTIDKGGSENLLDDITSVVNRDVTGERILNITVSSDTDWDYNVYDRTQYINTTNFEQIIVNGTILNVSETSCDVASPDWGESIVSGQTWKVCKYNDTEQGYYFKVVLPSLSTKSYIIDGNFNPTTASSRIYSLTNYSNSDLLGYCNITDADGENLNIYYKWYLNGVLNTSGLVLNQTSNLDNNINNITKNLTTHNDVWIFSCYGTDGTDNSAWMNSTEKTILNSVPIIDIVSITNTDLRSNNTLQGFCNASDYDEDAITYEYDWYKNNVSLFLNNLYLSPGNFSKYDNITFSCRATDGAATTAWKDSSNIIITSTEPTDLSVRTTPLLPTYDDDILGYCNATDYDTDSIYFYYKWYKNDAVISSGSTTNYTQGVEYLINTLSSATTTFDDEIIFSCMAGDGEVNSTWINSTLKTITYSKPVVTKVNPLNNSNDSSRNVKFNATINTKDLTINMTFLDSSYNVMQTFTNIVNGTAYSYNEVRAWATNYQWYINLTNQYSSDLYAFNFSTSIPPLPTNYRVSTIDESTITIDWDEDDDIEWTSYTLIRDGITDATGTTTSNTKTVPGLTQNSDYTLIWQVGDDAPSESDYYNFSLRTKGWMPAMENYSYKRLVTIDSADVPADIENGAINISLTNNNFRICTAYCEWPGWEVWAAGFANLNWTTGNDIRVTDYYETRLLEYNITHIEIGGDGGSLVQTLPDDTGYTGTWADYSYCHDEDWSTRCIPNTYAIDYFNYTIPSGVLTTSTFRAYVGEYYWDGAIPTDCFGGTDLRFRTTANYTTPNVNIYCQNNTDDSWIFVYDNGNVSSYNYETMVTWYYDGQIDLTVKPTHFNDNLQDNTLGIDGDYNTTFWIYYGNSEAVDGQNETINYSELSNADIILGTETSYTASNPVISDIQDSINKTATRTTINWTVNQISDNKIIYATNEWYLDTTSTYYDNGTMYPTINLTGTTNTKYYYRLHSQSVSSGLNGTSDGSITFGTVPTASTATFYNYTEDRTKQNVTVCFQVTNLNSNPNIEASIQYWNEDSITFSETSNTTINSLDIVCKEITVNYGKTYNYRLKMVGANTGYSNIYTNEFMPIQDFFAGSYIDDDMDYRHRQYCPNGVGTTPCYEQKGYREGSTQEEDWIWIETNISNSGALSVEWYNGTDWDTYAMSLASAGFYYKKLTGLDNAYQTLRIKNSTSIILDWTKPDLEHNNTGLRTETTKYVSFNQTKTNIDYTITYMEYDLFEGTSYDHCIQSGGNLFDCMAVSTYGYEYLSEALVGTAYDRGRLTRGGVINGGPVDTGRTQSTPSVRPIKEDVGDSWAQMLNSGRMCFAFSIYYWDLEKLPSNNITSFYYRYWTQDEWWSTYYGYSQARRYDYTCMRQYEDVDGTWGGFGSSNCLPGTYTDTEIEVQHVSNESFNSTYTQTLVSGQQSGFNIDTSDDQIYDIVPYFDAQWTNQMINKYQQGYIIYNLPDNTTLLGLDSDSDGINDYMELYVYYTNPKWADTDNDKYDDGYEVEQGSDPNLYYAQPSPNMSLDITDNNITDIETLNISCISHTYTANVVFNITNSEGLLILNTTTINTTYVFNGTIALVDQYDVICYGETDFGNSTKLNDTFDVVLRPNNASTLNSLTILTEPVYRNDNVTFQINYTDTDLDNISIEYILYINDIKILNSSINNYVAGTIANVTFNNSFYNVSDEINLDVRAFDARAYSNWTNSTTVIILNHIPIITESTIISTDFRSNNTMEGYCNASDGDGDNLTYEYDWYNNEVSLSINNINLTAGLYIPGTLIFSCRATDGTNYSTWLNSTQVTILNTEPVTTESTIITTDLRSNNTLEAFCNATDFDVGDVLTYEYDWYKNNISLSVNNINLSDSYYDKNDNIILTCRATDGTDYSEWMNSTSVTILNVEPVANSIEIDATYPEIDATLYCNVTDYDTDTLTYNFTWSINGVNVKNESGLLRTVYLNNGYFNIGDNISASCYATDGINTTNIIRTTFKEDCFQESANVSTVCGGLDTGVYYSVDSGAETCFDSNYSTSCPIIPETLTYYVNYTIPINVTNATIQITTLGYAQNESIPNECLDSMTDLSLKIITQLLCAGGDCGSGISCYNGATYYEFVDGLGAISEEAMIWKYEQTDRTIINHGISTSVLETNQNSTYPEIGDTINFNGSIELYDDIDTCYMEVQPVSAASVTDTINITTTGTTSIVFNSSLLLSSAYNSSNDNVSWRAWCNDTSGNNDYTDYDYFTVKDITVPTIPTNFTGILNNATVIDNIFNENIRVNVTFEDNNLFQASVNVTCEKDGQIYYWEILDINETTYNYDKLVNITGYESQKCNITFMTSDDHTTTEIPEYDYEIENDKIIYETENGATISIYSADNTKTVDTNKLTDRYNFEFKYEDAKLIRRYVVESDKTIYPIKESGYPGHFVVWNEQTHKGNWIDFNLENSNDYTYIINKLTEYKYEIILVHKVLTMPENKNMFEKNSDGSIMQSIFNFFTPTKITQNNNITKEIKQLETNTELSQEEIISIADIKTITQTEKEEFEADYGIKDVEFNSIGGTNIAEVQTYFYIGGVFNITGTNLYNNSGITNYTITYTSPLLTNITIGENATSYVKNAPQGEYDISITHPKYITQTYEENMTTLYDVCEQELANTTTACGGLNTGTYDIPITTGLTNIENFFDSDTTTYTSVTAFTYVYTNINYTIPTDTSFAIWNVAAFGSQQTINILLDIEGKTQLTLRIGAQAGTGNANIIFEEYNGTTWNTLSYSTVQLYQSKLYEEKMVWYAQKENMINIDYNTSQALITFEYYNIKTKELLDNYSITVYNMNTTHQDNYSITDGSEGITLPLNAIDYYNVSIQKTNYENTTGIYTYDYKEVTTETIYVSYYITFNIYDEDTLERFDFSNPVSTEFKVFCLDSTTKTYPITNTTNTLTNTTNTSTNTTNTSIKLLIECEYEKFKFILTYPLAVSYYRKLILPFEETLNQTVYLIDISSTSFVYTAFIIDDLLGEYDNPSIWVKKNMEDEVTVITSDYTDIENKLGTYLIENDEYIIEVHSDNHPIQVIGLYGADEGQDKIINMYDVSLETEQEGFFQNARYTITIVNESNISSIIFSYNDPENLTDSVQFKAYRDRLHGTLIYESEVYTNITNLGAIMFPITDYLNYSLAGEIIINHQTAGLQTVAKLVNKNWGISLGIEDYVSQEFMNWFFIILLSIVAIYTSVRTNIMGLVISGIALIFMLFGWFQVSVGVLGLAILISILSMLKGK